MNARLVHYRGRCLLVWAVLVALAAGCGGFQPSVFQIPAETIFDGNIHIEDGLTLKLPAAPPLCTGPLGLDRRRVNLGDANLYCEQEGNGTPLVLVHGGPGASHHYFHPWFSRAARFARIVYYDQRGCGQSDYRPGTGYSVDQAADDLHRLRLALGLPKWIVLGHSYGGALAQCYAVKYPQDLAGLVLVSASPAAPLPLATTRQAQYLSRAEQRAIAQIRNDRRLTTAQVVYNAFLNGDWKRQSYYRPSRQTIARIALYEWKHDVGFNAIMSQDLYRYDLTGAFQDCPVPTLLLEGRWDLTWNTDKPERMQALLPRARLVVMEHSGHSPFADEPEVFFDILRDFVATLPNVADDQVNRWKNRLAVWRAARECSPSYILKTVGYGRKSNAKIAQMYSRQWLTELGNPFLLLKTGIALYDVGRYADALEVFKAMAELGANDRNILAVALVWQGQMLDLLGKRAEAIAVYGKVVGLNVNATFGHDQFSLRYAPSAYACERLKSPFTRVENRLED